MTTSDSRKLTLQDIIDAENELSHDDECFVILNRTNGMRVEAIFNDYNMAMKYMLRIAINSTIRTYNDCKKDLENDGQPCVSFKACVNEEITYNYQIKKILVALSTEMPIYVIQNGNYQLLGDEYLTNDLEEWNAAQQNKYDDNWIETCTAKVNPKLPEIEFESH
jgi:hypothetical protein